MTYLAAFESVIISSKIGSLISVAGRRGKSMLGLLVITRLRTHACPSYNVMEIRIIVDRPV